MVGKEICGRVGVQVNENSKERLEKGDDDNNDDHEGVGTMRARLKLRWVISDLPF